MPKLWSQLPKVEDYPAFLDIAWAEHEREKAKDAPTVISTFAGCGGSSLGYSLAGFRELLAVEWDNNAVEHLKLNFPSIPIYAGDIAKLDVQEVLKITGLKPGELDLFDGSPPCQGFSTSGKRQFDDPRNQLFREYIRLLEGLRPKILVMENVSGMIQGKMKLIFTEILIGLKNAGYEVSARLLNAKFFGVPQARERLIFIGVRKDLGISPSHPLPQYRGVTLRQALARVPECSDRRLLPDWLKCAAIMMDAGKYNQKKVATAFQIAKGNTSGSLSMKLLAWDKTSYTLVKSEIADTGIIHPDRERYLDITEMKRISSFPDQYQMVGSRSQKVARLGNSVPPLMARAIGLHIRSLL